MTDWWRTQHPLAEGDNLLAVSEPEEPELPPPPPSRPAPPEPTRDEPQPSRRASGSRKKILKVAGSVAGVAIAGALALNSISPSSEQPSASASAEQEGDLPPAGGGPQGEAPAAKTPNEAAAPIPQETVTLTAAPSGKGRVGAIAKLSIRNDTSEALTVLATLVEGDGRPAIVGEGTLAPGSRVVQPGETAEGTVEFSSMKAPGQVVLLNLSGDVVAVSEQG